MKSLKKALRDLTPQSLQSSQNDTAAAVGSTESLAQTPASNTGLNSQGAFDVGVDWLDFTFRKIAGTRDLYRIIAELERLTLSEIDFSLSRPVFNGRTWEGSGRSSTGVLLWYDAGDPHDAFLPVSAQLKVAISGRAIAAVNQVSLGQWLISRMVSNELDCSRIDICLDDRDKFINLEHLTSAGRSGNYFNASYRGYQESGRRGQDIGVTCYFGSPSSSRRLRIYDKTIESNGVVLGNRWEVQFRKKLAKETLYQWLESIDENSETAVRFCKNVVIGAIDFRDRTGNDANRHRCNRLSWFQAFIAKLSATPIRIRAAIEQPTIQRSIDWIKSAVAPTLFSLKSVLSTDFPAFLNAMLSQGADRLNNQQRKRIATTKKEQLCYET
jgi:hypothetical protein